MTQLEQNKIDTGFIPKSKSSDFLESIGLAREIAIIMGGYPENMKLTKKLGNLVYQVKKRPR